MFKASKLGTWAAAGAVAVILSGTGVIAASGSTLSCTSTESCGGATLLYAAKGSLDLSVLAPDANVNGGFGYYNEHVGFEPSSTTASSEDFTVFQTTSESKIGKGGPYGLGEYVVMYTPDGKIPEFTAAFQADTAYCLSVQDTYPVVNHKRVQRWALVLRNCDSAGIWGTPSFQNGAGTLAGEETVSNPNPYQLWAPVEVSGPALEFQDVALNSATYRHGFGGGAFVVDDRGWGGAGTWGLAFPENDGLNQKFIINGCSDPITTFNSAYWNCASGATPAPTAPVIIP